MWLAETHYPVGDAFPAVIVPEVVLLLAVHPRDDFQITFLSDSQQVLCILMDPLNLTYLLQYLAEQELKVFATEKVDGEEFRSMLEHIGKDNVTPGTIPVSYTHLTLPTISC